MIRPPYSARVAAGLLVTVVEETKKLPTYAVTLPMTAVSQALQAGMRLQQNVAELAIKGDVVLDGLFGQAEEQPEWARFDEDEAPLVSAPVRTSTPDDPPPATGRFALYSSAPDDVVAATATKTPVRTADDGASADGIVADLDYDSLTLAQLRAKIRTVELDDLRVLVSHEQAGRARGPFLTMLENRIATKSEK